MVASSLKSFKLLNKEQGKF